jgi:hypothetical protein
VQVGPKLFAEMFAPQDLVRQAILGEEAGFDFAAPRSAMNSWPRPCRSSACCGPAVSFVPGQAPGTGGRAHLRPPGNPSAGHHRGGGPGRRLRLEDGLAEIRAPDTRTRRIWWRLVGEAGNTRGWPHLGEPIVRHRGRYCYVSALVAAALLPRSGAVVAAPGPGLHQHDAVYHPVAHESSRPRDDFSPGRM